MARQRREKNIQTSAQELYNSIPIGYFTIDRDYSILEANSTAAKLLGTTVSLLKRSKFTGFIAPARVSQNIFHAHIRQVLKTGSIRECELEMQRKDGARFFANLFINSEYDIPGEICRFNIITIDITKRKKVEDNLRESEERFRSVLDNTRDAIYRVNLKTDRFEYISASAEEILGYSPDELMAMDITTILTMIHPDDLPVFQAVVNGLKDTGKAEIEYRQRNKNGNYIWLSNRTSIVKDSHGSPLFRIGNIRDVTERKKAEDKLRESEERFSRAFHSNVAALTITNIKDGLVIDTNEAYNRLTGYSGEELIGHKTTELNLWADSGQRKEIIQRLYIDGKVRDADVKVRTKEGGLIDTIFSMEIIHLHGQDFALSTALDITERKKAEEALVRAKGELETKVRERTAELAESEEKYRRLVENASEAIMVFQDKLVKFFNARAIDLLGYSKEELALRPIDTLIDINDRGLVIERHVKRIQGDNVPSSYEFRAVRKDGTVRWVCMNAVLINWEGRPAVLGLITDITERKGMEETLKTYAQRITQAQEEERKRIAFELHDDTAQYLALLKLELDSLIHSRKIKDPAILKKLEYLEKDAGRAVDDVRRYSHELRPGVLEHLGIHAALEQIAEDINKINQFKVAVDVRGKEPGLSEEVKLGLFRIAQEAINNVRKHARAEKAVISLVFRKRHLSMMIIDNGTGFDTQGAKTRPRLKGSLGLMSMQERANLIGAELNIESKPGKGTIVRVDMVV